jgi:hypothetical protein
MALGDGIRRNVATISQAERDRLRDALLKLDTTKFFPSGISYWDMQEEIHKNAHAGGGDVHGGPAFIPWHRELCNRMEGLLREVDPDLSLHYWDWTTDPRNSTGGTNLFTAQFMGSASGDAGPPLDTFESTEPGHTTIWRDLVAGAPSPANVPNFKADADMLVVGDALPQGQQYQAFGAAVQNMHNDIHSSYIRGTIGQPHFSFHDPFVFLLHSNVDRLFAMWQAQPGKSWRLDPNLVYGVDGASASINDLVEPWAGNAANPSLQLRPWAPPENQQVVKTYKHPSVIAPPCYDTLPSVVEVVEAINPGMVINFNDVPEAETAARAAVFKIYGCTDVTIEIKPGFAPSAPYSVLTVGGTATAHHTLTPFVEARIWFGFTGTTAGAVAPVGSVTIRCVENGQEFTFSLTGNTIARPTVAVMLSLDQSGSMDDPAGSTGLKRIDVLRDAALRFVELIQPNNAMGIVRFDTDAYPVTDPTFPGLAVTTIGTGGMFDPGRLAARNAVLAHHTNINGATSIGDGVAMARTTLNPITGFDQKAMIVFTDGLENRAATIASVMSSIDQRTFAIGLGSETQVSTTALRALTNGTGGYLLLTGLLSSSIDDYFRLSKYFMQILAGVTNTSIVRDPSGSMLPGMKRRIPFVLNEADIESTVILLTDMPVINMVLETPAGDVVDPATAVALGATFTVGTNLKYYRFTLPLAVGQGAQDGTWHAVLEVDEVAFKRHLSTLDNDRAAFERARVHGARYSVNIHAYSNLRMGARLDQNSMAPGATMTIRATLTEYGLPIEHRATVRAELRRPDGTTATLVLSEVEPGVFEASTLASMAGTYHFRVLAEGATMRGIAFTREELLTGAVLQGGDGPFPFGGNDPAGQGEALCHLLECIFSKETLGRFYDQHGIDAEMIMRCIERFCAERHTLPLEGNPTRHSIELDRARQARDLLSQLSATELTTVLADIVRKARS